MLSTDEAGITLGSIHKLARQIRRLDHSLYNCVLSIIDDTKFVREIAGLYPGLPVFANLRCGAWYVPHCSYTCYFKSTDGHNGNWSFSTTRLNLHVAAAAAEHGGCIIVDATRRGKTFPDALTKTVPCWAAVLNRAVDLYRRERGSSHHGEEVPTSPQGESKEGCDNAGGWDTALHLPLWISENEQHCIEELLPSWVSRMFEMGVDMESLATRLKKPLRPLWICQQSTIWLNQVAAPSQLSFTPLLLLSASNPNKPRHQILSYGVLESGFTFEYIPGAGDDEESWSQGLLPSMLWGHEEELVESGPIGIHQLVRRLVHERKAQPQLVRGGRPDATAAEHGVLQPLVTSELPVFPSHRLPPKGCTPRGVPPSGLTWIDGTNVALGARVAVLPSLSMDGNLAVLDFSTSAPPRPWVDAATPVRLLPATNKTDTPSCSQQSSQGEAIAPASSSSVRGRERVLHPRSSHSSVAHTSEPMAWPHQQPEAVQPGLHATLDENRVLDADRALHARTQKVPHLISRGTAPIAEAGHAEGRGRSGLPGGCGRGPQPGDRWCLGGPVTGYCWLPVRDSKHERHALQNRLLAGLAFSSHHMRKGHSLVLLCDNGMDASVCATVAILLSFPHQEGPSGSPAVPTFAGQGAQGHVAADDVDHARCCCGQEEGLWERESNVGHPGGAGHVTRRCGIGEDETLLLEVLRGVTVSKDNVRRKLAHISSCYPAACPSRGMLKQVYNFFQEMNR
eukprot:jgi/Botrbrau1/2228/Bobra.101_2s0056.1